MEIEKPINWIIKELVSNYMNKGKRRIWNSLIDWFPVRLVLIEICKCLVDVVVLTIYDIDYR